MNGHYNRPLTLTDFLYLLALFLGIDSLLLVTKWQVYFFFAVIVVSLIVDWTSAFTMSLQGSAPLLLLDIFTSINYLCLFHALSYIDIAKSETYMRFFFHYSVVFMIYSIWNIFLLHSNDATQQTSKFLIAYTLGGVIFAVACLGVFLFGITEGISSNICFIIAWVISISHLCELLLWLKDTFLKEYKK